MKINQKWTYPILGLALLAMVFTGSLIPTQEHGQLSSIAAKVNDQEISKAEFARTYQLYKRQYEAYGTKAPAHLAAQTMRRLIQNRAWFEVARNNGALASNEEFTLAIIQNDPNFSKEGFKEWIERQGFTESQYAELVQSEVSGFKLNNYIQKLAYVPSYDKKIDHLLKETKIELAYLKIDREGQSFGNKIDSKKIDEFLANESAKKQVENYYNANIGDYKQERAVRVSNLLIDTSKRSQREADKKAEKLRKKLSSEKNKIKAFAELVVKETDEPNGKAKKGDLGFISEKSTDVPNELLQAALKLKKAGDLSQVVKTKFGYHVLIATAVKKARNVSFNDAQKAIALKILSKQQKRKESNTFTDTVYASLKANKSVEKTLKDHKLKWQTYSMALSPERSYYQVVPVEEFHKVALDLSASNPIASRVIRQKNANYIVKFVARKKPSDSATPDQIKSMMLQRAKAQSLLYLYQDLVFNKEYDLDSAFRSGSSNNHNIQINKAYLALDRQGQS